MPIPPPPLPSLLIRLVLSILRLLSLLTGVPPLASPPQIQPLASPSQPRPFASPRGRGRRRPRRRVRGLPRTDHRLTRSILTARPIRHSGVRSRNPVRVPRPTSNPPKSAPRRLKSFLEKTLIAHARTVFAARPPGCIAPARVAQPRPSRAKVLPLRSPSGPLAPWERVGKRVFRAPRPASLASTQATPTASQTPPKKAPRRLKSFLEKTLIAREAPSSTPTRSPANRAHPAPELTIAARGTSLIRLRSTTDSQVRQRGKGRA